MRLRDIAAPLALSLLIAGCEDPPQPAGSSPAKGSARPSTTSPAGAATGTGRASGELKSPARIGCGAASCSADTEICCDLFAAKKQVCKPAPASRTENELLDACGTRSSVIAIACDDSGDCPGDTICVRPIRHGSDASFATQECLAPKDKDSGEPERCGKGGVCKRPGLACGTNGLCQPARR